MIEVKVKNVASGLYTHGSKFETVEEANDWIEKYKIHPAAPWGKPQHDRVAVPAVYDEVTGELVTPAVMETVPSEFIVEIEDITEAHARQLLIEEKRSRGRADRLKCEAVLDVIAGFNRDRSLTMEQITEMQTLFANPEKALRSSRPDMAHALISAINADGVLVTQEMKDICLELLS